MFSVVTVSFLKGVPASSEVFRCSSDLAFLVLVHAVNCCKMDKINGYVKKGFQWFLVGLDGLIENFFKFRLFFILKTEICKIF